MRNSIKEAWALAQAQSMGAGLKEKLALGTLLGAAIMVLVFVTAPYSRTHFMLFDPGVLLLVAYVIHLAVLVTMWVRKDFTRKIATIFAFVGVLLMTFSFILFASIGAAEANGVIHEPRMAAHVVIFLMAASIFVFLFQVAILII